MKKLIVAALAVGIFGCATLTEDAMTPVSISFSDGSNGRCKLSNKRGAWDAQIPSTMSIRKSDDALTYDCETSDGRKTFGSIPSEMGGKIVASAVFIDFGITDAITDKHRRYPPSFVIPIARVENAAAPVPAPATAPAAATEAAPATTPGPAATPPPGGG